MNMDILGLTVVFFTKLPKKKCLTPYSFLGVYLCTKDPNKSKEHFIQLTRLIDAGMTILDAAHVLRLLT